MDQPIARGRFIPFRKADVVDMCLDEGGLDVVRHAEFRDVAALVDATIHFELNQRLSQIKDAYVPFDPNSDVRSVRSYSTAERVELQRRLVAELTEILRAANYTPIDLDEVRAAIATESLLRVRLRVDLDDFDEVLFFCRGESLRTETRRRWFGLRHEPFDFVNYERVLVYVKFKGPDYFRAAGRDLDALRFTPGSTLVKLFQDVPRADLESLFPNSEVRMRPVDKVALGVPALVSGLVVLFTKVGAAAGLLLLLALFRLGLRDDEPRFDQAALVVLAGGAAALGGYVWRQFTKFKNRKIQFLQHLTEHLYFRNLDNDAGVFHHLFDAAEEEEVKEATLAYYFLLAHGPLTQAGLDARIEAWFAAAWDCRVDFDVADGVAKLDRLGLVGHEGEVLRAVEPGEALALLDRRWDALFDFAAARDDAGDGQRLGTASGPSGGPRPPSLAEWARWQLGRVRRRDPAQDTSSSARGTARPSSSTSNTPGMSAVKASVADPPASTSTDSS